MAGRKASSTAAGGPIQEDDPLRKRLSSWRDKLLELLALGIPIAVLQGAFKALADRLLHQPWQAIWLLGPLALLAWIGWQIARGRRGFRLRGPALLFFAAYVSCFALAAATEFLNWSRDLTAFRQPVPRTWLAPNWMGDWRYHLVPRKPPLPSDLLIVTTQEPPEGFTREAARLEIAKLIRLAADQRARGIAFDFSLEGESLVDSVLCHAIQSAAIPVFLTYSFTRVEGDFVRSPGAPSLEACLEAADLATKVWGHSVGFLDRDHVVRFIPLLFAQQEDRPALSLAVAKALADSPDSALALPANGLLQFVEPAQGFPAVPFSTLVEQPESHTRLRDRFILVGEDSSRDRFPTPFGDKAGVEIHADAIHSLRHRHFIERTPWWIGFAAIFALGYLLTTLAAQGTRAGRLFTVAALASLGIVAASALALYAALLWVDVVYPLAALWLLVPLVLGLRKRAGITEGG